MNEEPVRALQLLHSALEQGGFVFRYLPVEVLTLASLSKEEFRREGHLEHTRITMEVHSFTQKKHLSASKTVKKKEN